MQPKTLDIITLFHKASSPASVRIAAALKQKSAAAWETATEDQASDHSAQSNDRTPQFELQITEQAPTPDQLQTILNYVGPNNISSVIKGATSEKEALRKFKENADSFQRPVVRPSVLLCSAAPPDMSCRRLSTGTTVWHGRARTSLRFSRCLMRSGRNKHLPDRSCFTLLVALTFPRPHSLNSICVHCKRHAS